MITKNFIDNNGLFNGSQYDVSKDYNNSPISLTITYQCIGKGFK
jgi:hypothetical protein